LKGEEEEKDGYTDFAVLLDLFVTSVKLEDQEGIFFMCDIQVRSTRSYLHLVYGDI
jgi:hypothetical protein